MKDSQALATLCLLVIALAAFCWMGRWALVAHHNGEAAPGVFRLDRWTGAVVLVGPQGT
jgi:hypothetical protein